MKQETETMEMVKDVEKVHEEEQIQVTQEDQASHALTFTDTLKVMEAVKDEYMETSKEQKDMVQKQEVVQLAEIEVTEAVKGEYVEISKEQKDIIEKREVVQAVKDEYVEINNEQKDIVEKVVQLTEIEIAQHTETTETKAEESNMPIEENEEAMLPEDGILLTYIEKQNWKNDETEMADNLIRPETEAPKYGTDIPMSRENDKISENSQKSHEMKEWLEDIAVTPSTIPTDG